jgi:hypothetical protein
MSIDTCYKKSRHHIAHTGLEWQKDVGKVLDIKVRMAQSAASVPTEALPKHPKVQLDFYTAHCATPRFNIAVSPQIQQNKDASRARKRGHCVARHR